MLCFVSISLIYKAYSLGLVHFARETLSVSFQKFIALTVLTLWGLQALQVVSEQRFCDLRLRHESCILYSRLGGLHANMKCEVLWLLLCYVLATC